MVTAESAMKASESKTDGICARVSETLGSAADSARAAASAGVSAIDDLANRAGKKLGSPAEPVRKFWRRNIVRELRRHVNRNPLRSLGIATAIGLVAGVSWRIGRPK